MSKPQAQRDDTSQSPFHAPATQDSHWTFDRSGAFERVIEIVFVSILGAFGGGILGPMVPGLRMGGGENMVVLGTVCSLALWATLRARSMWRPRDDNEANSSLLKTVSSADPAGTNSDDG